MPPSTKRAGMNRARVSDEKIDRILQEANCRPITQVAQRKRVSEPSIYIWCKKFGDMGTDVVKRLKLLEQEKNRLKKILAERDLNILAIEIDNSLQQLEWSEHWNN